MPGLFIVPEQWIIFPIVEAFCDLDDASFDCRRAQIICNMGDSLGTELNVCLPIFLERLKNEITRLTAVKSVTLIAA